jgi:AAA domain, putative AbiEii toxin, Type IV TA system
VAEADFSTVDGVGAFVSTINNQLWADYRDTPARPMRLRDQLRQGVEPTQVYDLIFGLEHLEPRFELTWNGRNLDQLSPGERGSLLLVFYLLIDLRNEPLVIDQPEENLDNETITALLIPAVKAARERRQVIMVTHSPNLAVVCDADQVIHARIDRGAGNRITYTTGSIENPEITPFVVDVLEGTMPAFQNRGSKYHALL